MNNKMHASLVGSDWNNPLYVRHHQTRLKHCLPNFVKPNITYKYIDIHLNKYNSLLE